MPRTSAETAVPETPSRTGASGTTVAATAAVWLIWGSTYLGIEVAIESIPPYTMQGIRFVVASVAVLLWVRRRPVPRPSGAQVRNAAGIGVLLLVGGLGSVTLAEDWGVDTGLVATIIAIQPLLMSLWGGVWGEWPRSREWVGMAIGLAGVVVLVSDDGLSGSVGGVVLVVAASVSWSCGSALSRRVSMPTGAYTTGIEMAAAAVVFLAAGALRGERVESVSGRSVVAVVYLTVFGSILAFSAFTHLIANVRPALAMSYAYVNPLIAVVLGVAFADESASTNMLIALPVIMSGVAVVISAPSRR
ncbi:MAG: drug/metabolite exporter YedA [Ilumatobacteraceae bacterium]